MITIDWYKDTCMSKTASANGDNDDNTDMNMPHYLMWFRRDLRLHDNTALTALCERASAEVRMRGRLRVRVRVAVRVEVRVG